MIFILTKRFFVSGKKDRRIEKSCKLFYFFDRNLPWTKAKWRKNRSDADPGSIIDSNEQKEIGASRVLVSLLETGSILRDVFPETVDDAALWPVDRANDRRKILFFSLFPFSPYFFLLLLLSFFLSFFFFFRHLSILCKLSKVCSRRTRGSSILESADRYISSFPFVTSFDSLIQYRFSIASQRISLEGRRIRNSLFSRWKISLSLSFIPIINDRNVFADLWNKFKLLKLSWLAKRTDLSIFKLIELSNIFPLSISNIPPRFLYSRQNMKEKKEFQLKVSWYETSSSI